MQTTFASDAQCGSTQKARVADAVILKSHQSCDFGRQLAALGPLRQGVCSQTADQPELWRPHNGTAEQPRAPQLETHRPGNTLWI